MLGSLLHSNLHSIYFPINNFSQDIYTGGENKNPSYIACGPIVMVFFLYTRKRCTFILLAKKERKKIIHLIRFSSSFLCFTGLYEDISSHERDLLDAFLSFFLTLVYRFDFPLSRSSKHNQLTTTTTWLLNSSSTLSIYSQTHGILECRLFVYIKKENHVGSLYAYTVRILHHYHQGRA